MDAILVFLVFGLALIIVYVQHYYDASITNIIAVVLVIISIAALCGFLFYPYAELSSMQDKLNHALNCLYVISASVIGLAVTAYVAARK